MVCRSCKEFKWDDFITTLPLKPRESKLCLECWDDKYKDWIEFREQVEVKRDLVYEKLKEIEAGIWVAMRNEEGRPVTKFAEPSWGANEHDPVNETQEFNDRYSARTKATTSEERAEFSRYSNIRQWMNDHEQGTATTDCPKLLEGIEIP